MIIPTISPRRRIIRSFLHPGLALVLMTLIGDPSSIIAGDTDRPVFTEDFEEIPVGGDVTVVRSEQWQGSGYDAGVSPGRGYIASEIGNREGRVVITTPEPEEGRSSATYNLVARFPEISEEVRVELDVYPIRGGGQVILNSGGSDGEKLVHLQFRGGRERVIRAFIPGQDRQMEPVMIGSFSFHQWHRVSITIHLDQNPPTYDVEIANLDAPGKMVGASGLECLSAHSTVSRLLIGSIFDPQGRFAWDNLTVWQLKE